jgi:hypothetical protein
VVPPTTDMCCPVRKPACCEVIKTMASAISTLSDLKRLVGEASARSPYGSRMLPVGLWPSQMGSQTKMRSESEPEMRLGLALDIELLRVLRAHYLLIVPFESAEIAGFAWQRHCQAHQKWRY